MTHKNLNHEESTNFKSELKENDEEKGNSESGDEIIFDA